MKNGGFEPGDLVRLDATGGDLAALDESADGRSIEAIVVEAADEDGLVTVATLAGDRRTPSGHVVRAPSRKLSPIAGKRFPGISRMLVLNRQAVLESLQQSLVRQAGEARITVDESALTELENYSRHRGVNTLPDDTLQVVVHGVWTEALRAARGDGRVGAGHIREVILQLCGSAWTDCSGAAAAILKGGDHGFDTWK